MDRRTGNAALIGMLLPVSAAARLCGFGAALLPFVPAAGWKDGLQDATVAGTVPASTCRFGSLVRRRASGSRRSAPGASPIPHSW